VRVTSSLLSAPIKIGTMELKNRMVMAPMGVTVGNMSRSTVEYFVERARGGASMIFCNVRASLAFESGEHSIFLCKETEPFFAEMTERCHNFGCKVGAQIQPGDGRIGGPSLKYRVPISASDCPWMHVPKMRCHALSIDEIHELENDFRHSVHAAIRCGADCIGIHAYGGYLTDQFLTKRWNTRRDEYGGSLENRVRFLKELIEICKEEGGADFPVIVKFTPDHYMDGDGYRKIDEGIELAKLIVSYGADALHVDAGCHENWPNAMPPAGMQLMTLQSRSAKIIKANVNVPVLTHGRFGDVQKAEAALRDKVCDIAVIGRGLLADPDLPNKVLSGHPDDIRPCISCNEGCIGRVYNNEAATCAMNPRCGHEDGSIDISKTTAPKKILVIGAGPGGCMAALYAKQAGHSVEIWEKSDHIGGNALNACKPYFKADMHRMIRYFERELLINGISVQYYTEPDAMEIKRYAPDHIILASGGRPLIPNSIPGLNLPKVYSATEALSCCCDIGERVIVVGGGLVGVETALQMDMWGKNVMCIDMAKNIPSEQGFKMNDMLMKQYMAKSNVQFMPSTKLICIDGDDFTCIATVESAGEQRNIECDTVLLALGFLPTADLAIQYSSIAPITVIGDSKRPRKIIYAIEEAYEAIRALG
jgi:2-enoate reductase